MKLDRLLAILYILLEQGQVTAPQLADRLEVSRRTISRDVDALCRAGFPLVTQQGQGGGISLVDSFRLDRSALTQGELQNILAGLGGLESVGDDPAGYLRARLSPSMAGDDTLSIDLASYYKDSLSAKIGLFRSAIREHKPVRFRYYSGKGSGLRTVEPSSLHFRWGDWYLLAFCRKRQDFRLFKLGRLWEQEPLEEHFSPRAVPPEQLDFDGRAFPDNNPITVRFDPQVEHLLVECYGPSSYTREADGTLLHRGSYTNRDHIIRWVLGFGPFATVLEPEDLRREIAEAARTIWERHSED